MFVGDSYSAGTGITDLSERWSSIVSHDAGWIESNLAIGGSGYVSRGPAECGRAQCGDYRKVVEKAATTARPSIIVVSGGRNDAEHVSDAVDGVPLFFRTLRQLFPGVPVYVISPIWDDDPPPGNLLKLRTIVKKAAASSRTTYVDIGDPLAGKPNFISEDGIHPNRNGYAAIASAVEAGLIRAGLTFPM